MDTHKKPAHPVRRAGQNPSAKRPERKQNTGFQKVLHVLRCIGKSLRRAVSRAWHALDVFRKDELSTILVNSAVAAAALIVCLCILLACMPSIRAHRARRLIASGETESALSVLSQLEADGYDGDAINQMRLSAAEKLSASGRYAEALSIISALPENAETQSARLECLYAQADSLWEADDYSSAAQIFYQLGDYSDSASRYADCRCALAVETYLSGDEDGARTLLVSVADADQHIEAAARKASGSEDAARGLLALDLFNPESLSVMVKTAQELTQARSERPLGRIAAGYAHSVARKSDGTALAAGDNSYGQCDVSSWTGLQQIAAGAYHTVGLREDGTVIAVGRNDEGQCDVSAWTDIVMIAASAYDTLGLKSDGTVVACGEHSRLVQGWHNVTWITGGSYSAGCLYDQGSMTATHSAARMGLNVSLYDLSVCGAVSAGVLLDGTLTCTVDAPEWSDLIAVSAGEDGLLGLTGDGRVLTYTFLTGGEGTLDVSGAAVEIAQSGLNSLVLTEDGRVLSFGPNESGQGNTSDWQLW
jgi:tetratricopeptide (TPR) repeat protein